MRQERSQFLIKEFGAFLRIQVEHLSRNSGMGGVRAYFLNRRTRLSVL